jgi:tetratricopeptide (TPR) repeat protein
MQRATFLFDQGRVIEAEVEIRKALSQGDDSSCVHALLSLCLLKARLVDDAQRELEAALARAPEDPYSHYAMSFVETAALTRDDFFGKRRAVLDPKSMRGSLQSAMRAVELAPQEERYLVRLAEVFQTQQRWQESIGPAEAALRLSPGNCSAAVKFAEALMRLRRPCEAREVLHRALELNPAASLAHAGMGWALLRVADHQRAEQFFNEALRMHADSEWAQEGALECAKHKYRLHRWICGIKRWFENQNWFVAVGAGLALAATVFGVFSAYFLWMDPFLRKQLGNGGFAVFTLAWVFSGAVLMFFHNEIFLWLVRRHAAAKTSLGTERRRFAGRIVMLLAIGVAFVPVNLFLERFSEIGPAILAGLLPGAFGIAVVIKTFAAGKRRWLWLAYVLLMIAASPVAIVAWFKFMEEIPKPTHMVVVMFLPFIPLFFACDAESKKALKRKHLNAVAEASRLNNLDSQTNPK